MANPPPARPWFRLPILGRQAPPPPPAPTAQAQPRAPAPPQPRPPFVRPAFAQAFRPPQPQPAPPQPPVPTRPPPAVAPSPTPRPVIAPKPFVSPSPSPPASPSPPPAASPSPPPPASPPNVASSRTPAMTSPKALGISSPSTTTPSEFTPEQSPKRSPLLSSASPRKPQVSEELPPRASSVDSPVSTFPPKSSSYPSINSFHSPTPTASPRANETSARSSPVPQSTGKFIRAPPPTSSPPLSESPPKFIRSPSPVSPSPQQPSKEEPERRALAEAEPKVVFQETFNKQVISPASKSTSAKVFYNTSSKYGRVKEEDRRKLSSDSEEAARNMRILTIAGENKGASMELGFSPRSNRGGRYFNGNSNVGNEARESEDLHNSKADWSGHEGMTTRRWPMNAYVNSNVQPINGSILLNCSLTQHDPGVHFSLSRKPINGNENGNRSGNGNGNGNGHGVGLKDHTNTINA